jgi:hypothetical protein
MLGDEPFEAGNKLVCGYEAVNIRRQRFSGVLVNDAQQFPASQVSGFVELEVEAPRMIAMLIL